MITMIQQIFTMSIQISNLFLPTAAEPEPILILTS